MTSVCVCVYVHELRIVLFLFDIDGTILLSGGAGARAIDRLFAAHHGIDGAMDGISPAGKTDPLIFAEVFEGRLGRPPRPGEVDRLLAAYVPLLREELARSPRFRLMPRVVEALDHLASVPGALLGLATGNVKGAARAKLERAALWDRFTIGGFGCDHADRAVLVARAIERGARAARRDLAPDEVVVIGDTPRDVEAARACGARAVAVATGPGGHAGLAEAGPDVLLDDLGGLAGWLSAAGGGAGGGG